MKAHKARVPNSRPVQPRRFWQHLLETIWAAGAGVLGTSLATLSQRNDGALGSTWAPSFSQISRSMTESGEDVHVLS